jgi:hypothetical protein
MTGNVDVVVHTYEQDRLPDAHALVQRAGQVPMGSVQVFILAFDRIVREAQNALLKVLEEPIPATYFALVVPTVEILLPTVRSRMAYQGLMRTATPPEQQFARAFLRADKKERVRMLEPLHKGVKDDMKPVMRSRAMHILDALEAELYAKKDAGLREVLFVRTYLNDTGSSLKMLFEHLAVVL